MTREVLLLAFDAFSVIFLLIWMVVFFALILQYVLNIFGGKYAIPFLPTPIRIVDMMLKLGKVKDEEKVLDIGSGTGSIVIRAAQKLKVEATGVEINLFLHIIGNMMSFLTPKLGILKLKLGSMFKEDLSKYDVLMLFLTTSFMEKYLVEKFEKELKKGARIVSYTFRFKSKKFKEREFETGNKGFGKHIYVYTKV